MDVLAHKIAAWLVSYGANKENEDVIAYGMLAVLYELFLNPIILIVAFLVGRPLEMVLWILFYIPLRRNMGGKHASTPNICFIISLIMGLSAVFLLELFMRFDWLLIIEGAFCLFMAFKYAPVLHSNHPYPDKWKAKAKIRSRIYACTNCCIIIILLFFDLKSFAHAIGLAMLTVATLCCWSVIGK